MDDDLKKQFKKLTYREREVLKLRFGLDDNYTYTRDEVARIFKVPVGRVRTMELNGLAKLGKYWLCQRLTASSPTTSTALTP